MSNIISLGAFKVLLLNHHEDFIDFPGTVVPHSAVFKHPLPDVLFASQGMGGGAKRF